MLVIAFGQYSCKKDNNEQPPSAVPFITSVQPKNPAPGDVITITGSGFGSKADDIKVRIGDTELFDLSVSPTKISLTLPESIPSGDLSLLIKGELVINKDPEGIRISPKTNNSAQPTFTAMSPGSGKTGDIVTLTGTNFSSRISDNKVFFATKTGGTVVLATIKTATATTLTVEVPANAITGTVMIDVNGVHAVPATGFSTTFTINPDDATGSSSVDYIKVITGGLKFSKVTTASSEIGAMYLDKGRNMIYYSDYTILKQTNSTVYKFDPSKTSAPAVLTTDARITAILKLTTDAAGNIYALKYNGDLTYNVFKISPDGTTVTEVVKNLTTTANSTSAYYFFVNSRNEVCLRPDLKYTDKGERILGASSLSGLQMKDGGAIYKDGIAYITRTTTNSDQANKLEFLRWNLETDTYGNADFTLQSLFNTEDPERFSTNNKIEWLKYAADNNDNLYVMFNHSYIAGSTAKTWMLRKTKNGSGSSSSLGSFVLKFPAVDLNDYNSTVEFVADASGNLYFKANTKDIIKITL